MDITRVQTSDSRRVTSSSARTDAFVSKRSVQRIKFWSDYIAKHFIEYHVLLFDKSLLIFDRVKICRTAFAYDAPYLFRREPHDEHAKLLQL